MIDKRKGSKNYTKTGKKKNSHRTVTRGGRRK